MYCEFNAKGDVYLITGGANGICRALAVALSKLGAEVIIFDNDSEQGQILASHYSDICFVKVDVADEATLKKKINHILELYSHIDGVICAAAIQPKANIQDIPSEIWQNTFAVNCHSIVWCYQEVIHSMINRKKGCFLAFSSGLAHSGWPQSAAYAASKAAVGAFIKSAGKEVAADNIRVNLISPGVINTKQYRHANSSSEQAHWQKTLGVGIAEDVIGPLLFLLSEQATMTASLLSRDYKFPFIESKEA